MVTNPNPTTSPAETLSRLAEATTAYLEVLKLSQPDIEAMGDRACFLRDLVEAGLKPTEWGTVASIDLAIGDLVQP
jgi:hypothetical protein